MEIDINDQTNQLDDSDKDLVKKVLSYTANLEDVSTNSELSVSIVTNNEIKQLNQQFRQKNVPTDVLSFPMDEPLHDHAPRLLGDIIISIDKVREQSKSYGHSFKRELLFLAVHGFLHLLGYTHDEEDREEEMFKKQNEILKVFQLERE